jgi:hypothetical protein
LKKVVVFDERGLRLIFADCLHLLFAKSLAQKKNPATRARFVKAA